ncbi:S1 family peptidase [Streptococcus jiangjianxini]|uniref:S1 family peptidase n=1 Tax=Streptococcus jiangjianxini TaxID=3161189 RepID=UPI0032ECA0D0
MKKLVTCIALGFLLLLGNHSTVLADKVIDGEKTRTEIQKNQEYPYQSVVRVQYLKNKKEYGTGFFVGRHHLVTNKHVVNVSKKPLKEIVVRITGKDGKYYDYPVKKITPAKKESDDMTILEIGDNPKDKGTLAAITPLKLASPNTIKSLKKGDKISAIGYPGDKPYGTLWESKGKLTKVEPDGSFLTFAALIYSGNSGSPLINEKNELVGLVNASTDDKKNPKTFGFLLRPELRDFLTTTIKK